MSTPSLADLRALDAAAVEASVAVHAAMREGRGTKELHAACDEAWQALVRACASVGVASICLRPVKVDELNRASFIPHVLSIKS